MRVSLTSDLHLDCYPDFVSDDLIDSINSQKCDLNIIAGDIHSDDLSRNLFLKRIDKRFHVKGNHDYYGSKLSNDFRIVEVDGLKIVGCTLWTSFDNANPDVENAFKRYMSDYTHITSSSLNLIQEIKNINKHNIELILSEQPDIVVTHHCPTLRSIHERFSGNLLNLCFSNDYEDILKDTKIKYWCYGHTHWRHNFTLGNTKFLCNPYGYPGEIREVYSPMIFEV